MITQQSPQQQQPPIFFDSNRMRLKLQIDDNLTIKQRLQKVRSQVSLQQTEPFTLNQETWQAKKDAQKLMKAIEIVKDNKRLMKRISEIVVDGKKGKKLWEKQNEHDHFIRKANMLNSIHRQKQYDVIQAENKRIQSRLMTSKSQYNLPPVLTPRNKAASPRSLAKYSQLYSTTPRETLISREKDYQSGQFIEKQATKLLTLDRQVIFKKTIEISQLRSIQGRNQSQSKPFLVEISQNPSNEILIAAYDLTSDENFLLILKKKEFKMQLNAYDGIENLVQHFKIVNNKLKIKQIFRNNASIKAKEFKDYILERPITDESDSSIEKLNQQLQLLQP